MDKIDSSLWNCFKDPEEIIQQVEDLIQRSKQNKMADEQTKQKNEHDEL